MPLDNVVPLPIPPKDDPFAKYNTPASPILFPVVERKVSWETRTGWYGAPHHKAIVRVAPDGTSPQLLAIVGHNYKLIHNRELVTCVEDTMIEHMTADQLLGVLVKDKVANFGRECYREYIFPNMKCHIGGGVRSDIAFRMIVQNGYGGSALRIHAGAIEFYCTNGMISGEFSSAYRKHTAGLVVDNLADVLDKSIASFIADQAKWKQWAHKKVRYEDAMELFRTLATSPKMGEAMTEHYMREVEDRGPNLWSVYSTMTYYASHNDGDFKLRKTVEEQDSVAHIMLRRELNVARWVDSHMWHKLEGAHVA